MKRTVAFIIIVIFSLSLFPPVVSAWDKDWNDPKYSTGSTDKVSTSEGHPWGELNNMSNCGYEKLSGYKLFIESSLYYIKFLFFGFEYMPPEVIIIKHTVITNDCNNNNETEIITQENENENNRIPYGG